MTGDSQPRAACYRSRLPNRAERGHAAPGFIDETMGLLQKLGLRPPARTVNAAGDDAGSDDPEPDERPHPRRDRRLEARPCRC
jgi:hypothetical protein